MVGHVGIGERDYSRAKPAWRRWLTPAIAVAAIALAAWLLSRTLGQYSMAELRDAVAGFPLGRLGLAAACAAASYLCLTGFDFLALRYVGKPLAYHRAALAGFTALSLGHNIGLAALSSGAVRYRFYARWGLGLTEIAQLIVFCGITVGLGLLTLGGIALLARPDLAKVTGLEGPMVSALGAALLALAAAYLALAAFRKTPIHFRGHALRLPGLPMAAAQILLGTVNFAFVAGCLYNALAAVAELSYLETAGVYVIANATALVSHVPGGLGVIESVVMYLVPAGKTVGALMVFRLVYFLVPLPIGALLFLASEVYYRRKGA